MRTLAALILLTLPLVASCDPKPAALAACAISDEKLSIAFSDPVRAKDYLVKLGERLKAGEPDAVREAADLAGRLAECVR